MRESDRAQWARLWAGYHDFYKATVAPEVYDLAFARLLGSDPNQFNGLVAEQDGKLVGLTHYLFHAHGWKVERVCYLQDLYADPDVRGTGIGRALIEAVYAAADAAGAPSVYWLTQEDNHTARRLYDRVGEYSGFVRYNRPAP
ncbi:GNAT family N-acetyltransferase [Aliishimia ponticola]|uniref:GNAT family N-acetyltransferase n=1 Tax=Aliishimia ponticola TaxID=2499833 RepID=UPI001FEC1DD2|nr:GNAT family N-acetyltransferase [Aliishimia ponticola]